MSQTFVLRGGQVVRPGHPIERLDILVREGRIAGILQPGEPVAPGLPEQSAAGLHVFPGCIDAHVHLGFADRVAEYETETAYAARGGITTILTYLLSGEDFDQVHKREAETAAPRCHIDYGYHFSAASEDNLANLGRYVRDYGITSFKYFMNFKGEEGRYLGLDGTDDGFLYDLLAESARVGKVTMVCHTENIELVNRVRRRKQAEGGQTLADWAAAKPPFTEAESCVRAMLFAEHTGARVYFPHISSRLALDEIRRWRSTRYDQIFVETCPHYLTHTERSPLGPLAKGNPPMRTADDLEALWEAIADGTVDVVGSDHSARRRDTKMKNMWVAAQGFPGIATILPVLLSEGFHKRGLSLQKIAEVITSGPAKVFDLLPRKGRIAVGADADLTLVDIDKQVLVTPELLGSWCDYTLYENTTLKGWPVRTLVRGATVMEEGKVLSNPGYGHLLRRSLADRV